MHQVAILGTAQWVGEEPTTRPFYELATVVAEHALEDAGLDRGDVDAWVMGEYDLPVGRTAAHMYTVPAAGGFYRDEIRIHDDGLFAAIQAYCGILSGAYDVALVVSTGVASEASQDVISTYSLDPFFVRPLGLTESMANALQAACYRDRHSIREIDAAQILVTNRRRAAANVNAGVREAIGLSEVLKAPYGVYPLRTVDIAPLCDGASAIVMAAEPVARRLGRPPVWIRGVGWANDTYHLGEKDLATLPSLEKAAMMAYGAAMIRDPIKELDVMEIYDVTPYHELMVMEALGLGPPETTLQRIDCENNQCPELSMLNPSGGLMGGRPLAAAGLVRLVEAVRQVTGRAGDHQVINARTALAQAMTGWGNQRAAVVVVGR